LCNAAHERKKQHFKVLYFQHFETPKLKTTTTSLTRERERERERVDCFENEQHHQEKTLRLTVDLSSQFSHFPRHYQFLKK